MFAVNVPVDDLLKAGSLPVIKGLREAQILGIFRMFLCQLGFFGCKSLQRREDPSIFFFKLDEKCQRSTGHSGERTY